MIKVELKDGSKIEVNEGTSILEIAKQVSEGLARNSLAGKVNGEVKDLRTQINEDCKLELLTFDDEEGKKAFWHTTSHIMAQAVKRIYGDNVKLTIGPSIDNGFYYDFDVKQPFTEEDLFYMEDTWDAFLMWYIDTFGPISAENRKIIAYANDDCTIIKIISDLKLSLEIPINDYGDIFRRIPS